MSRNAKKECCPRDDLKVEAGEKLAVVTKERDGKVCCIYLFKTDELLDMVRDRLGPLLSDAVEE